MPSRTRVLFALSAACLTARVALAANSLNPPLVNWPAPPTWSAHSASRGATTMGDISNPVPLIGVTPCRQYDSRDFTPLPQNTTREVVITGAPCGLPLSAAAVSLNVTVFDIVDQQGNAVFQVGTTSDPLTAWINYGIGTSQIGNAGALPLSPAHSIFFRVQQGGAGSVNFTIDVNGYYPSTTYTNRLASGEFFSIYGTNNNDAVIIGENDASTGNPRGVRGRVTGGADNSAGVLGDATAGNGVTHGVFGRVNSNATGASGVLGVDAIGFGAINNLAGITGTAGVRGEGLNGGVFVSPDTTGTGAVGGLTNGNNGTVLGVGLLGAQVGTTGYGVFAWVGTIGCNGCTKQFVDPHPTDANKTIHYVSLEGNEAGTYFRGTGRTVNGEAVIEVPEDFQMVTDEEGLTVQLTPVGKLVNMAVIEESLQRIVVRSSKDVTFHYLVQGIRPAHKDFQPIQEGSSYWPQSADARMPEAWPEWIKQRLVANGTYNSDGSVNVATARRLGWDKLWEARANAGASR